MPIETTPGQSPLIVVLPYAGSTLPQGVYGWLTDAGRSLSDTDSYLDRLISGLADNPTLLRASFQRCVSDVEIGDAGTPSSRNDGNYIGIVPRRDRAGRDIWLQEPTPVTAAQWRSSYYAPFHAALNTHIARLRSKHGRVVIATIHTLRTSDKGDPSDIVISTNLASRSAVSLSAELTRLFNSSETHTCQLHGQTSAKWITRSHSKPEFGVQAIQISINTRCYLTTTGEPGHYDDAKAMPLRTLLRDAFRLLSCQDAR